MVKVIRKADLEAIELEKIGLTSTEPIMRTFALTRTMSLVQEEPKTAIKKEISIKFDEYGNPNIKDADIGLAFDHRVTWLRFDLDDLIWNTNTVGDDEYTNETKYDFYLFKLAFKNLFNDEVSIYEFDGKVFEVPRSITAPYDLQVDGKITQNINYEVLLIIQEKNLDDPDYGNVEGIQETFVSKSWNVKVEKSSYEVESLNGISIDTESFQLHSLTKPAIVCRLSDIGIFNVNHTILGNKEDDTITYFKLGEGVTAHLQGFNVFMRFEYQDDDSVEVIYRQWEPTTESDAPKDDYNAVNPHILWVPSDVTARAGNWKTTIIAYCGYFDLDPETTGEEIDTSYDDIVNDQQSQDANANANGELVEEVVNTTEDYYFYVSKDVILQVEGNFLDNGHLKTATGYGSGSNVKTSGYSNLTTEDGLIFATADDSVLFGNEQ